MVMSGVIFDTNTLIRLLSSVAIPDAPNKSVLGSHWQNIFSVSTIRSGHSPALNLIAIIGVQQKVTSDIIVTANILIGFLA
jgi:hypothetical protein